MELLPDSVLVQGVLPRLDAASLGRFSCCSRRLRQAATLDSLWFPICRSAAWLLVRREWDHILATLRNNPQVPSAPQPWRSWHHLFCFKQNRRCVECKEHTPYVHTLSYNRLPLCERCEYACPKYAVVTELEAKQRFRLTDQDLQGLSNKKINLSRFCVYFFLKTDVELATLKKGISLDRKFPLEGESNAYENASLKPAPTGSGSGQKQRPIEELQLTGDPFEESTSTSEEEVTHVVEKSAEERNSRKELRKEHKRQVKAAKRERRVSRSSPVMNNQGRENLVNGEDRASWPPHEAREKERRKWRKKREHVAVNGSHRHGQTMEYSNWKVKTPSDWIREREILEIELGPYGFSALELAPPC